MNKFDRAEKTVPLAEIYLYSYADNLPDDDLAAVALVVVVLGVVVKFVVVAFVTEKNFQAILRIGSEFYQPKNI